MKVLRHFILILAIVISGNIFAQKSQQELQQLMQQRNEYYFTFSLNFVPMGLTICFVLLKLLGGFATDVSWWWIVGTIVLDLIENVILKNWMDGKYS